MLLLWIIFIPWPTRFGGYSRQPGVRPSVCLSIHRQKLVHLFTLIPFEIVCLYLVCVYIRSRRRVACNNGCSPLLEYWVISLEWTLKVKACALLYPLRYFDHIWYTYISCQDDVCMQEWLPPSLSFCVFAPQWTLLWKACSLNNSYTLWDILVPLNELYRGKLAL